VGGTIQNAQSNTSVALYLDPGSYLTQVSAAITSNQGTGMSVGAGASWQPATGFALQGSGYQESSVAQPSADPRTAALRIPRAGHRAVALPDGRILVSGGTSQNLVLLSEIYDPSNGLFSLVAPDSHPRTGATATVLTDGSVVLAGGVNGTEVTALELIQP
jgi:hypothetical protein